MAYFTPTQMRTNRTSPGLFTHAQHGAADDKMAEKHDIERAKHVLGEEELGSFTAARVWCLGQLWTTKDSLLVLLSSRPSRAPRVSLCPSRGRDGRVSCKHFVTRI